MDSTPMLLNLPSAESRDAFRNLAGRAAPAFNPTKPIKKWADPSKLNLKPMDRVTYEVFDGTTVREINISAMYAANVNLPDGPSDGLPELGWPCKPSEGPKEKA